MKKVIAAVIALVLLGFLVWKFLVPQNGGKPQEIKIVRKDLRITLESSGKVKARLEASLGFLISGELETVASTGARFKKGEVLAKIKNTDLWAVLQQAYANLNKTRSSYSNTLELKSENDLNYAWKGDDISRAKVRQYNANVEAAASGVEASQFAVDQARANLNKAFIRAPFDGMVGQTNFRLGETVIAGGPVLTFLDPRDFYFEIEVDETDVGSIKLSQEAKVSLDAFPGQEFEGLVESTDETAHTTSSGGTAYNVKINLESKEDFPPRSGFNGQAQLLKEEKKDALVVPATFVTQESGKSYVNLLVSGRRQKREVSLGEFLDGNYEVLQGLSEGDLLVTR